MAAKRHIAPTPPLGLPPKRHVQLSEAVVRKLKPALLRVVKAVATEHTLHQIAQAENISVNGVVKRLNRVHKLLGRQSTIGVYRTLLLAGIIGLD